MFSVVIPTMWRYEPFYDFLIDLSSHPLVDEVIVFDNDSTRNPKLSLPKNIVVINLGYNIGVNPAWNIGVHTAKQNMVCIVNDDIIFDLRLLRKIKEFKKPWTIAGLSAGDPVHNQVEITNGKIDIVEWEGASTFGFGQLIFVKKDSWIDIPAGLKIYYGDNWMFETTRLLSKPIYIIQNILFSTPCAVTTSEVGGESILREEFPVYRENINKFVIGIKHDNN